MFFGYDLELVSKPNASLKIFARRHSVKKMFKNFAKFTGKLLCQNLFFDKVAGVKPATLLKKRL